MYGPISRVIVSATEAFSFFGSLPEVGVDWSPFDPTLHFGHV